MSTEALVQALCLAAAAGDRKARWMLRVLLAMD